MKFRFENLQVWQDARNFINQIYTLTKKFPTSEKFALIDQLRRAAVSIALNITEGSDRKSDVEFSRYLRMAITSTEEVVTALYIALDQKYISQSDFDTLYKEAHMIVAKLNALVNSLRLNSSRKTVDSRHQRGFTLVELLIAISIIAVLSTVGLATYSGIQSKARDSVRKNDLNALATALAIYREQNGQYIVNSDGTDITSCPASSDTTSPFYTLIAANLSTSAPKDPKTGSLYCYISVSNGRSFRLFARLEDCNSSSGNLCGDTSYNYTVVSEDLTIASATGDALIAGVPTASPTPSASPIASTSPSPSPSPLPSFIPTSTAYKRVFLTSTTYNGNLGGLSGADAKCQARADAKGLGGTWKAWLSTTTSSVAGRFTPATGSYKLLNGTTIANDWTDLTDGSLASAINLDENQSTASCTSNPNVWTFTDTLGGSRRTDRSTYSCLNWVITSSDVYSGVYGLCSSTSTSWTNSWTIDTLPSSRWCSQQSRLYCFEQ